MSPRDASLRPLFRPRSVALLGASADPTKLGGRTLINFRRRYSGRFYAINPRGGTIDGLAVYRSVAELPEAPELAIVSVPVAGAVDAVAACAERGIKSAVVFTSGFAELDAEGGHLQARLVAIARDTGMRVLGPNCMGYLDIPGGIFASFAGTATYESVVPGSVAILSQSGAIGTLSLALARERGLGISLWITTGNQCDVDFSECLAYLAEDEATKVIVAGLEGCRDGDRLREALRLAHARRKPVIMLKIGTSKIGAAAAVSHTGTLAGNDAVYDAVFAAHGVHRARNFTDLMDVAQASALGLYPENDRLGIVTVSGGVGVMMADEAVERGLRLTPMPAAAQARLRTIVPFSSVRNPVDATTVILTDPVVLRRFLDETLAEGGYGAVLVFLATLGLSVPLVERTVAALEGLRAAYPTRQIVFVMATSSVTRALVEAAGFRVFDEPVRAVAAIAALERMTRAWRRPVPRPATKRRRPKPLALPRNEHEALTLLARAGIPTVPRQLATSRLEAMRAAARLGLPAALKISSPDIVHKSDVGGVALDVGTRRAVGAAFDRIMKTVRKAAPRARLDGVLVAPMIEGGVELILGVESDPVFGPVVLLGLGGFFVETFKDTALRLAPVTEAEAMRMIRALRGYPLLVGARGRPSLDLAAIASAVAALSRFAVAERDSIESVEVNPFVVLPKGAVALDALIVPRATPHPAIDLLRR